jgi:hypothetical protein
MCCSNGLGDGIGSSIAFVKCNVVCLRSQSVESCASGGDFDVHDVDVAVEHQSSAKAPGQTTFISRYLDLNIRLQFQWSSHLRSELPEFGTWNNVVVEVPSIVLLRGSNGALNMSV